MRGSCGAGGGFDRAGGRGSAGAVVVECERDIHHAEVNKRDELERYAASAGSSESRSSSIRGDAWRKCMHKRDRLTAHPACTLGSGMFEPFDPTLIGRDRQIKISRMRWRSHRGFWSNRE
jgi:hypothetical protein